MPELVVDSSVAVKWFVVEPYSIQASQVLDAYYSGELTLLAPDSIYAEVGNVIWKKQSFQGLSADDGQQIITSFRKLKIELTSTADLLEDAYNLAVKHQRAVYDMMYLALSQRTKCDFVTADERLVNAVKGIFPKIIWLATW